MQNHPYDTKNALEANAVLKLLVFLPLVVLSFGVFSILAPSADQHARISGKLSKPYDGERLRRIYVNEEDVKKMLADSASSNKIVRVNPKELRLKTGGKIQLELPSSQLSSEEALEKAIAHIDSGQFHLARELLENALKNDPNNENLLVELGMVYLIDYRQPENARAYLERALKVNPSNKVVMNELVNIYSDARDGAAGKELISELLKTNPNNPELNLGMAQMHVESGDTASAVQYFEKAIANGEHPDYIYSDLGEIYISQGQYQKAISTYSKAAVRAQEKYDQTDDASYRDLNEDLLDRALLNLAAAHRKAGDFSSAEQILNRILSRRPNHQEAKYQKSQLRKNRG